MPDLARLSNFLLGLTSFHLGTIDNVSNSVKDSSSSVSFRIRLLCLLLSRARRLGVAVRTVRKVRRYAALLSDLAPSTAQSQTLCPRMRARQCFRLFVLAVICAFASAAAPWTPSAYPNPMQDVQSCGRNGKASWICDPDHILSEYSADVVEGTIKDILQARDPYHRSPCSGLPPDSPGYQVAFATTLL